MYIVSNEQMRRIEKVAFDHGMPEAALMEKAGCAVAARILTLFDTKDFPRITVLAGTGHNGADALVVARELLLAKRDVIVWCADGEPKSLREAHKRWFISLGGRVVSDFDQLGISDLIVDGLLGFGTTRPPCGKIAEAIDWCNLQQSKVVSIDNPSGLCTDTGHIFENAVRATRTFCLGVGKEGLFQDSSEYHCGDVEIVDIGLSDLHIARVLNAEFPWQPKVKPIHSDMVSEWIPIAHKPNANKFSAGSALSVAGSYK
jgi:NAD(P)H-hydrate epimerase